MVGGIMWKGDINTPMPTICLGNSPNYAVSSFWFLCWSQRAVLEERALLMSLGNPTATCLCKCCLLKFLWVCRWRLALSYVRHFQMCVLVSVCVFKRLLLQLTIQTCYFLPLQEGFGEMPGIPLCKNRTDHGVASGSSVPHVIAHECGQVQVHTHT